MILSSTLANQDLRIHQQSTFESRSYEFKYGKDWLAVRLIRGKKLEVVKLDTISPSVINFRLGGSIISEYCKPENKPIFQMARSTPWFHGNGSAMAHLKLDKS